MMNKLTTVFCFCFFTFGLVAQSEKSIKNADAKFDNFAYIDAREIYLDVVASGFKSDNIYKKLGDSYYFNNELTKSLVWYEKLYNYQKKIEPVYLFRYAMALKSAKRYDEADVILKKYNESIPDFGFDKNIKKQSVEELMNLNADKYIIKRTTINSALSEYAPSYYLSNLAFVSNKQLKEKSKQINHEWNNQPFSDLYYVTLKRNNELDTDIKSFGDIINSPFHESSCVFTKDGKTMYFSRNNYTDKVYKTNAKGVSLVKIYKSIKDENEQWQTPTELSFNSDEYSCAHPALSKDEKTLFFSSDMPGTKGMSDIFMSEIYEDGSYGSPINLEGNVNTPGRESYPFVSANNQLFFSSDGHYGLGGLDVFVTDLVTDFATNYITKDIINLGAPLNGSMDDFSLIFDNYDNSGFFASNRNDGAGFDDIYSFTLKEDLVTSCKQHIVGNISDNVTDLPLNNLIIQALNTDYQEINKSVTDEYGNYSLDLDCNEQFLIRISGDNVLTHEELVTTSSGFETNIQKNFKMKEGQDLQKTKVKYGDDLNKILQLEPIYFDFDKSIIRPEAEVELQKIIAFLSKNNNPSVDIRSHTDSQGESDYNLNLSELRAQATINYIIHNGINPNRVTGRGYGDTQLINRCAKGVVCSDAQHQLNRRSEFILYNDTNKKIINTNTYKSDIVDKENKDINHSVEISTSNKKNVAISNKENAIENDNLLNLQKSESPKQKSVIAVEKGTTTKYNFDSDIIVFTIQLAALKNIKSDKFNDLKNVFKHTYSDGLTRYFTGVFSTYEEAQEYKVDLISKGYTMGFITMIKGEQILKPK